MPKSPEEFAHIEWLGYVQPIGLVVSIPAMLEAQCYVNKNIMGQHARFLECLVQDDAGVIHPEVRDLREFVQAVLGWEVEDLVDVPARQVLSGDMAKLEVVLPQYNETLRPTHAVPVFKPEEGQNPWLLLIQELPTGTDLDDAGAADSSRHWNAAPQAKFERLLRETEVPIGLLSNGRSFRLVYSPRGETSGYATFNVDEMAQVAGRPMFAALHMLLSSERMFSMGDNQRLPAILTNSRKYQNTVSTQLAEQVMAALFDLLRGLQAANDHRNGELLDRILENDPQHVYHGLLTVLMRLVFILYAEDRGLVSSDPIYSNHYSVSGLFNRMRSDHGRFPDTMDQRFGSWAQLLTLFRLIYGGGQHDEMKIPPRDGYLFDPNRYPFLEGRFDDNDVNIYSDPERRSPVNVPRISDGVVFRVLRNLLILNGDRLSYRTLDVEQIGSVYEAIMGFEIEVSGGRSIAIKPQKKHGAPATINLDAMLDVAGKDRAKWLKEHTDQKLGKADAKAMKDAKSIDEILVALDKKIAKSVTHNVVPDGSIVFQPSDERRRSGSHYTPRSLTEPIVATTLKPILKQLTDPEADLPTVWEPTKEDRKKKFTKGEIELRIKASERKVKHAQAARQIGTPHPSQILDLKICDPAMGSGAFLVEACRQLGDELIKAWYAHDAVPTDIPPDEDEVLYARRLIAQRCLYGVDKNVMAVDLAKLSLWLVTLAKDHAFTFLDHALRHGDSLVGLTREQIIGFHWEVKKQKKFGEELIQRRLDRATEARAKILNAREDVPYRDQQQRMASADEALDLIRLVGDACVSGFFAGQKKKEREEHAERLFGVASSYLESLTAGRGKQVDFESRRVLGQAAARLRAGSHPIPAFHWEIEFPEVFARENGGFDAFVGNPPFMSGADISRAFGYTYNDYLFEHFDGASRKADLCAFFFRRVFELLNRGGSFGLIATNTIAQTTTKKVGIAWMVAHGGTVYAAERSKTWPGDAAVIVSHVWMMKGDFKGQLVANGKPCTLISNELESTRPELNIKPEKLNANTEYCYEGSKLAGTGFFLEIGQAADMLKADAKNSEVVKKCVGGRELNEMLEIKEPRWVIDMEERTEEEARSFPIPFAHLEEHVKPQRIARDADRYPRMVEQWWKYFHARQGLYRYIRETRIDRALVRSRVCGMHMVRFIPTDWVFTEGVVVFCFDDFASFAVMQGNVHDVWLTKYASTMKLDVRYVPLSCFRPFPFPKSWRDNQDLTTAGETCYSRREALILENRQGLTDTYNRFHDPHEQSEGILELRRLHGLMDGAVLRAYGWDDLAESARCEFLLDYEEEEDDADAGPPAAGARKKSKKKKPWRLRWPDEFRDEVLARLLELNEQRHQEELLLAKKRDGEKGSKGDKERPKKHGKRVSKNDSDQPTLEFGGEDE
ncbi:hypothetical protein CA13_19130 [Planctomycetes bacterium CA13]|uniref:site-specific DNA-methyltransferase (adenine-specific) n=1 Tax=Novipirellula herctigrandis TaxID=2527986 RepID=A0A5C5YZM9_9BACT|nr:hypothetical protein CA13_19130 [Planctomycetes bacterium CA13]